MMITVLYKVADGQKFDQAYYMGTHIPLVHKLWGPEGLKGIQVLKGTGTASGSPAEISVIALLDFESMAAFQGAAKAHGSEIMGDVVNFTDTTPTVQFNDVLS